jgi:HEAT repeat protein
MATARSVEAKLSRLQSLRQEAAAPQHLAELRKALGDRSNLVAAEAAEIIGARLLSELAPDLVAAFARFMRDPVETDKLCRAKVAIVDALNKIDYQKEDVFLSGIHHVQMEPRWGGEQDSAAPLRASSAFGLVRINYPDMVLLLADLLADPDKVARQAAVQALGQAYAPAAIPLLRFKARVGDEDDTVTAECLTALMSADPSGSLPFVLQFLHSPREALQEGAAFALAESRRPDALDVLKQHWPKARHDSFQEVLLLAISMTRLPAALDFLLEVLSDDNQGTALSALSALAIHRHNESIKQRIAAIVKKGDAALQERFRKKFEAKET